MKTKKVISFTLASFLASEILHSPCDLVNNQPHTSEDIANHDALIMYLDPPGATMSTASFLKI